ncbi:fibronectin type III domain-containing protein [Pontiella sulfatireligans]|uniref:Amylopullulanase n=1 Tax=Pontiella sulfatireligans TaxID=2750658 RepID=A0A6C2UKE8_9BACT|nr:hypothetical protein [Pontiella sulfatireligans]VGO20710.1 hypothetical protein SCARR_02777 [Pontiella sulfatireligans]
MKKRLFMLLALAASLSVSMAQTIVNTGFTTPYTDGDLAGQQSWIAMPNTGVNAFDVTDAAGSGFADTVSTTLSTNGGNYVYRSTTGLGNATSDEWDGVMDFTLSVPVPDIGSGDAFRIGLSTSSTNGLGTGAGDLPLRFNTSNSGDISINDADGDSMLTIDAATLGWNPAATNLVTDQWRLSWKLRKTTVSDTYTMTCSMENLDNPTNFTGSGVSMVKTEAYASSGLHTVMGRPQFAEFGGTNSINITIDDLSVIKSSSQPVKLYPTPVTSEAGDAVVNLSWADVVEASSYDVKRSDTIDGTYSAVAGGSGITTNGFADATVINGNVYYYKVTSINGGITADSDPVLAEPDAPVTGLFLDTTFDTADGYTDGDLAGQDRWKAIADTGEKAFNVISSGDGFAETKTYSNEFSNALDRQVYYNKLTENGAANQWSGTVQFRLEATPNDGLYETNIVGAVTNIQTVAVIDRGQIFDFGLTSDSSTTLDPNGLKDVLIDVRMQGDADIDFGLNGYNSTQNTMLELKRSVLGWDPEWNNANESNAPVFNTEWITLNWSIRKTAIANTYSAVVSATIGTNTYSGIYQYTDSSDNNQPTEAYIAESVRFGMGHSKEADGITAAGGATNGIIHVNVDALSVTHTNASQTPTAPPYDLTGTLGDLSVTLEWLGGFEADSFDIYRSDTDADSLTFLDNVVGNSYEDTGLTDLRTYFYAVVAKYDGIGDSAASDQLIIRSLGFSEVLSWNSVGVVSSDANIPLTSIQVTNGILNVLGTYTDGAILAPSEGPGDYSGTAIYGIIQKKSDVEGVTPAFKTLRMRPAYFDNRINANGTPVGPSSQLLYMKAAAPIDMTAAEYQYEMTAAVNNQYRAAFRDSVSGKWYVSDGLDGNITELFIEDMTAVDWRELTLATLSSTNLMSGTDNPIVTPSFTSVDAVGLFLDNGSINHRPLTVVVKTGSAPSKYDLWTDGFGIYNADAARTNDYDHDGRNNVWEWGFDGNPILPNIQGVRDYDDVQVVGTNLVYIYPRLKSADRPDYFLTEDANLLYLPDFTDKEGDYTITAGGTWTNKPNLEIVTNMIPTADAVKFIKLNIE